MSWTVAEYAKFRGVSVTTVLRWLADGKLEAHKAEPVRGADGKIERARRWIITGEADGRGGGECAKGETVAEAPAVVPAEAPAEARGSTGKLRPQVAESSGGHPPAAEGADLLEGLPGSSGGWIPAAVTVGLIGLLLVLSSRKRGDRSSIGREHGEE